MIKQKKKPYIPLDKQTQVNLPQELDDFKEDGIEYVYSLGRDVILARFLNKTVQFVYNVNSLFVPYSKIDANITVDTDIDILAKKCATFLHNILIDRLVATHTHKNFLEWFLLDGRVISNVTVDEAMEANKQFNTVINNLNLSNELFGDTIKQYADQFLITELKKHMV